MMCSLSGNRKFTGKRLFYYLVIFFFHFVTLCTFTKPCPGLPFKTDITFVDNVGLGQTAQNVQFVLMSTWLDV